MSSDWTTKREVWKVSEIAREGGFGESTVRSWCESGLLPTQRTPGGHYRIRASQLRSFLNGQSQSVAA